MTDVADFRGDKNKGGANCSVIAGDIRHYYKGNQIRDKNNSPGWNL